MNVPTPQKPFYLLVLYNNAKQVKHYKNCYEIQVQERLFDDFNKKFIANERKWFRKRILHYNSSLCKYFLTVLYASLFYHAVNLHNQIQWITAITHIFFYIVLYSTKIKENTVLRLEMTMQKNENQFWIEYDGVFLIIITKHL